MNALLLLSLLSADAEPAAAPKGPAPQLVYLKGGKIVRLLTMRVPVTVEKEVTKLVDGKEVKERITVTEYKIETKESATALGKATFSTAAGKKLDGDDAKKALEKDQVAIISYSGEVDAAFLKAFKGDTLVIVTERVPIRPILPIKPGVRPLPAPLPPVLIDPVPAPLPPVAPKPPVKE